MSHLAHFAHPPATGQLADIVDQLRRELDDKIQNLRNFKPILCSAPMLDAHDRNEAVALFTLALRDLETASFRLTSCYSQFGIVHNESAGS